ncbi:MAG: aldolase [Candidatus Komeilibacteria bacterium]|nr:aldolase [Candidatus Komeilibacteria bacterium]
MTTLTLEKITKNGRGMLLAYDHGFEHGPVDFDDRSVDPAWIMEIAESGYFTGVIFQKGIASKYYDKQKHKVPLVVKLNGKSPFHKGEEPLSLQNCSVDEAIELGAVAVGYTIYVGSEHEQQMIAEFAKIEEEAHGKGLIVIGWMYPRGAHIIEDTGKDILAYAARFGQELNCDAVKIKYSGDPESFSWVVKSAGKTAVFVVGGEKTETEESILQTTRDIIACGATGWAIGRNIWMSKEPIELAKKIADILYK